MKYAISDTHFFHYNIIKYCNRPFTNINDMNNLMIENWNKTINPDDTVIHLGDFGFGRFEILSPLLNRLNGYKILILGNHDKRSGKANFWQRVGFNEVYNKLVLDNEIIVSHYPVDANVLKKYKYNYHGHIHNNEIMNNSKYKNFSVEVIQYTPVLIEYTDKYSILS